MSTHGRDGCGQSAGKRAPRTQCDAHDTGGRLKGVDKLPVFGAPPPVWGVAGLAGISYEMLRCTHAAGEGSPMSTVNILHAAEDLDSAAGELSRMAAFMEDLGFEVVPERGPIDASAADVLVLGIDEWRRPHMNEVLDVMAYDIGLVQGWDVLLYGTSGKISPETIPYERPLCAGPSFRSAGVRVLYGHIRLRTDARFWEGFFAHAGIELEDFVNGIVDRTEGSLHDKIECVGRKFEHAGLSKPDIELFLAAAHLIRDLRNTFVHSQRGITDEKKKKKAKRLQDLRKKALLHKRPYLTLGMDAPAENRRMLLKCLIRAALATRRWIRDYHNPAAAPSVTGQ